MTAVASPPAHVGRVNIHISRSTVAGIAGFIGLIAIWQILGMTVFADSGAVPPPTAIIQQMRIDGWAFYGPNIETTAREAAWGWVYGNGVAIGLAVLFIQLPLIEKSMMRVAITAYCLPIIAIGPILQIVFDGDTPKIILAAMTCFFTTLIGALVGLRSASPSSIDLVTAYGGGQWAIMRKVRMKSSLPALFAGLRIAGPAAVLGAIIGEYLGGDSGLGVAMIASQQTLNIDRTWGIAMVSTAMAGIAYGVTALVGRSLTPLGPDERTMTLLVTNPTLAAEISDNDGKAVAARGFVGRMTKMLLSAVVSIFVVAGVWWLSFLVFQVDAFVGRTPANILGAMTTGPVAAENRQLLFDSFGITLRDAFFGLAAGMIVATASAISFNLLRSVEHTVMPVAMVLQSVPLVALTPLLALLFGRGLLTTTIIAGIVTFFPALVNVNLALRNAPASSMDLMRAYDETTATTLKKVQFPCALPAVFASLRIAAPFALIGALLAEWLATAEGLGYLMLQSMVNFNYDLLWAAGALVTFFSIVLYNIISSVEGAVLARYAPEHVTALNAR